MESADKEPAASAAAAPAQDVANQQVHPERQAKLPGTAAGLGVGLLVACVAAARTLQLVQQILIGVVVRLHRNRRAGLLLRTDVVAQALIGKGRVVVPLGGAAEAEMPFSVLRASS